MRFSERLGYEKPKLDLQLEEITEPLRNAIWDICLDRIISPHKKNRSYGKPFQTDRFNGLLIKTWSAFLQKPKDTIPSNPDEAYISLRKYFFDAQFPYFYNLIEIFHDYCGEYSMNEEQFADLCNAAFEEHRAALRFISGQLSRIIDQSEIDEVERATNQNQSSGVSQHISRSIELYSDRTNPDYRNSIKESISAVEAAAKQLVDSETTTLGAALKVIEKQGDLHSALKQGFSSLYGWTNDAGGIRHAILDSTEISEEDARYMLVSCSAFANYLLSKKT